jgi:hypothetical protein
VVAWADFASVPPSVWFAHFHPDSGLGPRQRLSDPTGKAPQAVQVAMDSSGALCSMWIASGPGSSEVHYQRRPRNATPFPPDTTLVSVGGVVQAARLTLDPSGGAHVIYQSAASSVIQLHYKRWVPGRGWDQWATEVTPASDGSALDPLLVAEARDRVTALYTREVPESPRFFERRRTLDTPLPITAVRETAPPRAAGRLMARPNPLRPGQPLDLACSDPGPGERTVEVHDVAGRRVAVAVLGADGRSRSARIESGSTARWRAGVYFARIAGERGPSARLVVLK